MRLASAAPELARVSGVCGAFPPPPDYDEDCDDNFDDDSVYNGIFKQETFCEESAG